MKEHLTAARHPKIRRRPKSALRRHQRRNWAAQRRAMRARKLGCHNSALRRVAPRCAGAEARAPHFKTSSPATRTPPTRLPTNTLTLARDPSPPMFGHASALNPTVSFGETLLLVPNNVKEDGGQTAMSTTPPATKTAATASSHCLAHQRVSDPDLSLAT